MTVIYTGSQTITEYTAVGSQALRPINVIAGYSVTGAGLPV